MARGLKISLFVLVRKTVNEALDELTLLGLEPSAIVEGEEVEVYVIAPSPPTPEWQLAEVNWEEEWRKNSHAYKLPFQMLPGPGFGDLSHPTTELMLEAMRGFSESVVIDVGCGSGILTLEAAYEGCEKIIAIDIDPEALLHTEKNLRLNGFKAALLLPSELPPIDEPALVLMNMIRSEQRIAFEGVKPSLFPGSRVITSGVLAEERDLYLAWAEDLILLEERELSGWLCFIFKYT